MSRQTARPSRRGAARASQPLDSRIAELERVLAERNAMPGAGDNAYLLKLLPDAVLVHCEGKVVFANNAAARLLGAASPQALIGKETLSFIHPDFLEAVKQRSRRMIDEKLPTEMVR